MKPKDQFRIFRDPNNLDDTKIPTMPLLVVFEDGTAGEANTIRGAVALIVGKQYFDAEDGADEWHYRLEASRKESMKAILRDVYAVTYDSRKGVIENNYAAEPEDPDYELEAAVPPIKIRIENERLFLLSLMQIESITVLERDDSYLLKPDQKWEAAGQDQCCNKCLYNPGIGEEDEFLCPVYMEYKKEDEGRDCSSFSIDKGSIDEYPGGTYVNIDQEYNLDELIEKVGQLWITNNQDGF